MKMVIARDGDLAVVRLAGRLDGEWAEHLSDTLDDLLREGLRSVTLESSEVDYVSSAGAQVLAAPYQEFSGLRGELRVLDPSPAMLAAVTQAGLEERILLDARAAMMGNSPKGRRAAGRKTAKAAGASKAKPDNRAKKAAAKPKKPAAAAKPKRSRGPKATAAE